MFLVDPQILHNADYIEGIIINSNDVYVYLDTYQKHVPLLYFCAIKGSSTYTEIIEGALENVTGEILNGRYPSTILSWGVYRKLPLNLIEKMLKKGADPNIADEINQTPLFYAAKFLTQSEKRYQNTEYATSVVAVLLRYGATLEYNEFLSPAIFRVYFQHVAPTLRNGLSVCEKEDDIKDQIKRLETQLCELKSKLENMEECGICYENVCSTRFTSCDVCVNKICNPCYTQIETKTCPFCRTGKLIN